MPRAILKNDVTEKRVRFVFRKSGATDFWRNRKAGIYFLKAGQVTVGRIFTDEDFVEILNNEREKLC